MFTFNAALHPELPVIETWPVGMYTWASPSWFPLERCCIFPSGINVHRYVELEAALALAEQHWEETGAGDDSLLQEVTQLQGQLSEQTAALEAVQQQLAQARIPSQFSECRSFSLGGLHACEVKASPNPTCDERGSQLRRISQQQPSPPQTPSCCLALSLSRSTVCMFALVCERGCPFFPPSHAPRSHSCTYNPVLSSLLRMCATVHALDSPHATQAEEQQQASVASLQEGERAHAERVAHLEQHLTQSAQDAESLRKQLQELQHLADQKASKVMRIGCCMGLSC